MTDPEFIQAVFNLRQNQDIKQDAVSILDEKIGWLQQISSKS
jgi:hypothetical protein